VRIFLAGASGVIGQRLIPLLIDRGHIVGGMTRSADKVNLLQGLGAEPIFCDVYDAPNVISAVASFMPDLILHQLTDLPDDPRHIREQASRNARIRREGTRNLLAAREAAFNPRIVAQSVAWAMPVGPSADAINELEASVLAADGTVLRYGQFYGPGTYYKHELPTDPRVHIDAATIQTIAALEGPSRIVTIVD
jgi:nucleoside-diphosphate-sugar epimerase